MDKLNILSLHRMGDPLNWREAVRALEFMMPENAAFHNNIVHDTSLPLPDYIKELKFHAIILGSTFLDMRYHPAERAKAENDYSWLTDTNAAKIALPQDDYDCNGILDDWMCNWEIDRVYTICPEYWDILYPNYSSLGEIKLGYTGYIADNWISSWSTPKCFEQRKIDVSYRASNLPANFGSIGNLKGAISQRFINSVAGENIVLDISTKPEDQIPGNKWHDFIEDSKFCLVTPSGSSLLDPYGKYRQCVQSSTKTKFEEIRDECFPKEDKRYIFTCLSPRNIEAALACTVQIATPGSYSSLMEPIEHYIPLEEDCSNISDVLKMMEDVTFVGDIRKRCKELMLDTKELYFSDLVSGILSFIESIVSKRNIVGTTQFQVEKKIQRYHSDILKISNKFWSHRRRLHAIRNGMKKIGGKRLIMYIRKLKYRLN